MNENTAPTGNPIAEAIRLLTESADELRQGISICDTPDWANEPDAKAAYDEHLAVVAGLRGLAGWNSADRALRASLSGDVNEVPEDPLMASIRQHAAARKSELSMRASPAVGDMAMPVIAYLRATKDGVPVWAEDCVCEDAIWPMEDDHGNELPDVSMALVKQSDAQAALAAKDSEIAAMTADLQVKISECDVYQQGCDLRQTALTEKFVEIAAMAAERDVLRKDAALGKVAIRFVDRAGDVHPGIDDAETICAEFYAAMTKETK